MEIKSVRSILTYLSIAAVALMLFSCANPKDGRPGLRISGDLITEFPDNWEFTNSFREIAVEVNTPYWLPHSVTIWCGTVDGDLYVAARAPETKFWPGLVDRNPNVRLRIDDKIYEGRLSPLDDPDQIAAVQQSYADKYNLPNPPPEDSPLSRYWLVKPRG